MENGTTHQMEYSSTNATYVFEASRNSLSDGGTIFVKSGNYTLEGLSLSDKIRLVGESRFTTTLFLADGSNCPLISNGSDTDGTWGVIIEHFTLDGNKAGQTSEVSVINWTNPVAGGNPPSEILAHSLTLRDVTIVNGELYGIWACYGRHHYENVKVSSTCDDWSIYWTIIWDSTIKHSQMKNMRWDYCGANIVHDVYHGGGTNNLYLYDSGGNSFTTNRFDNSVEHGVILHGTQTHWNKFTGNEFSNQGNGANNTYSSLRLYNGASNNTIEGNPFYSEESNKPKYCIEETGTSDYNLIADSDCRCAVTIGILTVGANTKVSDSWNGTTWIS